MSTKQPNRINSIAATMPGMRMASTTSSNAASPKRRLRPPRANSGHLAGVGREPITESAVAAR